MKNKIIHRLLHLGNRSTSSETEITVEYHKCANPNCSLCLSCSKIELFDLKPRMLGTDLSELAAIDRKFSSALKYVDACCKIGQMSQMREAYSVVLEAVSKIEPYLFSALSTKICQVKAEYDSSQLVAHFLILVLGILTEYFDRDIGTLMFNSSNDQDKEVCKAAVYAQHISGLKCHDVRYSKLHDLLSDLALSWSLLCELIKTNNLDSLRYKLENYRATVQIKSTRTHTISDSGNTSGNSDGSDGTPVRSLECFIPGSTDSAINEDNAVADLGRQKRASCEFCILSCFSLTVSDLYYENTGDISSHISPETGYLMHQSDESRASSEAISTLSGRNPLRQAQRSTSACFPSNMWVPHGNDSNIHKEISLDFKPKKDVVLQNYKSDKNQIQMSLVDLLFRIKKPPEKCFRYAEFYKVEDWLNSLHDGTSLFNIDPQKGESPRSGSFLNNIFRAMTDMSITSMSISDLDVSFFRHTNDCDCENSDANLYENTLMHLESCSREHILTYAAICRSKLRPGNSFFSNYRSIIYTLPTFISYEDSLKACLRKAHSNLTNHQSILLNGQPEPWSTVVVDILGSMAQLNLKSNDIACIIKNRDSFSHTLTDKMVKTIRALYFTLVSSGKLTIAYLLRSRLVQYEKHLTSIEELKNDRKNDDSAVKLAPSKMDNLLRKTKSSLKPLDGGRMLSLPISSMVFAEMKKANLKGYMAIKNAWSPLEMAHTLTIRDEAIFHRIMPSELINWLVYPDDPNLHPNISVFVEYFDQTVIFIRGLFLLNVDSEATENDSSFSERCKTIQKVSKTLEILLQLRNYHSSYAFLNALNCKQIANLGWPKNVINVLKPYNSYLLSGQGYEQYKADTKDLIEKKMPCIPHLAFVMREMVQMKKLSKKEQECMRKVKMENNPSFSRENLSNSAMINFRENIRLMKILTESFERFKAFHYVSLEHSRNAMDALTIDATWIQEIEKISQKELES